ncbi:hypothetical protein D0962_21340 [Leptolyngbyaceae cyanobacterium CCMR0082]|uniref:Uncharacterized protein n=1 Tax=Adonisia turfae CCMR0082 TaxID=2304604 RepID=A0A6M0S9W4_9CYAN|nr:hypothetical protein [Adonisia turfae]NEZ65284.1 hypothetical protein [Adonisia turfae CCMR0082]
MDKSLFFHSTEQSAMDALDSWSECDDVTTEQLFADVAMIWFGMLPEEALKLTEGTADPYALIGFCYAEEKE